MCNAFCTDDLHAVLDYSDYDDLSVLNSQYGGLTGVVQKRLLGDFVENYRDHGIDYGDTVKVSRVELAPEAPVPQKAIDMDHPYPIIIYLSLVEQRSTPWSWSAYNCF